MRLAVDRGGLWMGFRIKHGGHFVYVFIYKKQNSMWVAADKFVGYNWSHSRPGKVLGAGCAAFNFRENPHIRHAALFFYRGYFGSGVVAHECYHAARKTRWQVILNEERMAELIGELNRKVWVEYYRAKKRLRKRI